MDLNILGSFCFGIVIGWVTHRTLIRSKSSGISDIATVIGTLGGAAITNIWKPETGAFGSYCVGLLVGFFSYAIISLLLLGKEGRAKTFDSLGSIPSGESAMGIQPDQ